MIEMNQKDFLKLVTFIKDKYGINLFHKKTLIEGRLASYVAEKGFDSFEEFLQFVFADKLGLEITQLVNKLTTNHTFFMRESNHYEFMENVILPHFESNMKEKDIRIWSAGCSSGEEAYTTTMVLQDYFEDKKKYWDLKILATDISHKILEKAISGIYPISHIENLSPLWKLKYFTKINAENYKINDNIRSEVIFRIFNLMENTFPFKKKFHIIFCRNVMIYFDQETKTQLFKKFYEYTEPGGYLFIGHSESMGKENPGYEYVMPAIFRKGHSK